MSNYREVYKGGDGFMVVRFKEDDKELMNIITNEATTTCNKNCKCIKK